MTVCMHRNFCTCRTRWPDKPRVVKAKRKSVCELCPDPIEPHDDIVALIDTGAFVHDRCAPGDEP